jgi:hypothetical protein
VASTPLRIRSSNSPIGNRIFSGDGGEVENRKSSDPSKFALAMRRASLPERSTMHRLCSRFQRAHTGPDKISRESHKKNREKYRWGSQVHSGLPHILAHGNICPATSGTAAVKKLPTIFSQFPIGDCPPSRSFGMGRPFSQARERNRRGSMLSYVCHRCARFFHQSQGIAKRRSPKALTPRPPSLCGTDAGWRSRLKRR